MAMDMNLSNRYMLMSPEKRNILSVDVKSFIPSDGPIKGQHILDTRYVAARSLWKSSDLHRLEY